MGRLEKAGAACPDSPLSPTFILRSLWFFLPLQDPMPLCVLGWGMEGEVVSAKKGIVSLVAIAV